MLSPVVLLPAFLIGIALLLRRQHRHGGAGRLAPLLPAILVTLAGCENSADATGVMKVAGNAEAGRAMIESIGCGTCHTIPGVAGADGLVGPPLIHLRHRVFIAGMLRNTPANMVTWITDPQSVVPGNAMPDMGLTPEQAQDIAAYLYTLE
jgi:cytochrome c2